MVFPLLVAGAEIVGGFVARNALTIAVVGGGVAAGSSFGNKAGDKAVSIAVIAVVGFLVYLYFRKQGRV